ncbi:alpha/beta fold hydrolase [Kutzneria buriramensis]|uniref:Pimeloyl-ACP methyl ester carboxylesterase n=1 Tax=Kutzneria buriramensis TaxID=1045776 RepID=A0A3E0HG00_9PSEU|nr:alpha/beta hydrolase [Kutzneria buriramensis]REH44648.1 pimeloyl-ACP methyl ester carboxylesterase [Kutzneria buriramensis]
MTENASRPRCVRRGAAALAAGTVLLGSLAACDADSVSPPATASSTAPSTTGSPAAAPDPTLRTVSNNGHKLAFHLTPGHLPAIVLDAGGGLDSSYWRDIAPKLAHDTGAEIITYDRAGSGASDEVSGPWKAQDAVSDLEAGLTQLGATHDVILVSHSLAGEIATCFVNKNPHWVTGAVLVDASLPDLYTDAEVARIEAANQEQVDELKKQPSTKQTRQLLAVASDYGDVHRAYHQLSWPTSIPATVIVSAKTPFDTPDDAQLWRDAQAHFAAAAPNRNLVVAQNSSHDIPVDRPDVVITAAEDMAKKLT